MMRKSVADIVIWLDSQGTLISYMAYYIMDKN